MAKIFDREFVASFVRSATIFIVLGVVERPRQLARSLSNWRAVVGERARFSLSAVACRYVAAVRRERVTTRSSIDDIIVCDRRARMRFNTRRSSFFKFERDKRRVIDEIGERRGARL